MIKKADNKLNFAYQNYSSTDIQRRMSAYKFQVFIKIERNSQSLSIAQLAGAVEYTDCFSSEG